MHAMNVQVLQLTIIHLYNHMQVNMDVLFYCNVQILCLVYPLFHSNTTAELDVCTTLFHQRERKK